MFCLCRYRSVFLVGQRLLQRLYNVCLPAMDECGGGLQQYNLWRSKNRSQPLFSNQKVKLVFVLNDRTVVSYHRRSLVLLPLPHIVNHTVVVVMMLFFLFRQSHCEPVQVCLLCFCKVSHHHQPLYLPRCLPLLTDWLAGCLSG